MQHLSEQVVDGGLEAASLKSAGGASMGGGRVTDVGAPVQATDAATKQYVDDKAAVGGGGAGGLDQAAADARYVNVAGDTMSGDLRVSKETPRVQLYHGGVGSVSFGINGARGAVRNEQNTALTQLEVADPKVDDAAANKRYVDSRIVAMTQQAYNALPVKDSTVLYVIVG